MSINLVSHRFQDMDLVEQFHIFLSNIHTFELNVSLIRPLGLIFNYFVALAVADPGFPVGEVLSRWGGGGH